ncbi:terminase small subunit [Heyndrickxia acidicola]|uniref:Terminase small subunit n=1 Tax=Heyndrickxia acidicola TaxID=209389 RepID=A0ABU6MBB6_9BACI|nr:terminase small subunit [Heyndrickxia acidicola]MED1201964.1 terminase small subunit [Heyndrickxia acidicola]
MPRRRDPKRDEAFEIFKKHDGKITNRALAAELGIPEKTIGGWKSKDKWNGHLNGVLQTKIRSTPNKSVAKKARSPSGKNENKDHSELTDKQRLFCVNYLKYFNATKAYQSVYKCSYLTARVEGHRHLTKPNIKNEIERLKADYQLEISLDGKAVLQKYIDIAFADITDFVDFGQKEQLETNAFGEPVLDENGDQVVYKYSYVDFKNADEVDGTLITEVKKGKDGVSVKLADKMKALEFLSKYTDLLSENDRKKLQNEKLRMDIEKTKAEVEKISTGSDEKPVEIVIKRGVKKDG